MKKICKQFATHHKPFAIRQSGQAIIYVILLGASVLGAALSANQNILVDILRTKRLEEANIAYYQAEGALEEALLDLKLGTPIPTTPKVVNIPIPGQNAKATKKISTETIEYRPLTSDELLPKTDGVLKKDQSFTMDIPAEWKNVSSEKIPVLVAVGQDNIKDIYGEQEANKRLEFRAFHQDGTVDFIDFVDSSVLRNEKNPKNVHQVPKTAKSIQFKPYGVDIKFSLSVEGINKFSGTNRKTISAEGEFGGSSRQIELTIDEQTLKPLPIFDFGLFSQQSINFEK